MFVLAMKANDDLSWFKVCMLESQVKVQFWHWSDSAQLSSDWYGSSIGSEDMLLIRYFSCSLHELAKWLSLGFPLLINGYNKIFHS